MNETRIRDFENDYYDSQVSLESDVWYVKKLMELLPGSQYIKESTKEEDRKGVDVWVQMQNGRLVGIDLKIMRHKYHGIPIEYHSNVESNAVGWSIDVNKTADFIAYIWESEKNIDLFSQQQLLKLSIDNFQYWRESFGLNYNRTTRNTKQWTSSYILVPREFIIEAFTRTFLNTRLITKQN